MTCPYCHGKCKTCAHWRLFKPSMTNPDYNKGRCTAHDRVTYANAGCGDYVVEDGE